MFSSDIRPKWWKLYLVFPLLIALFIVDSRLNLSIRGHIVVQLGILVIVFRLMHLWIKANACGLSHLSKMDRSQDHGTITVIRIPPYQPDNEKSPMFHLPDSEIKGVLSDTFEIDYFDSEFLPSDEIPQEIDKE